MGYEIHVAYNIGDKVSIKNKTIRGYIQEILVTTERNILYHVSMIDNDKKYVGFYRADQLELEENK